MLDAGLENKGSGRLATWYTRMTALALFRGDSQEAVRVLKEGSKAHPELLFVSLAMQLVSRGGGDRPTGGQGDQEQEKLDFNEVAAAKTDPYLHAISSFIATGDWALIAGQRSLPLRDRAFVAVRNFDDDQLTAWLASEIDEAVREGDIEGIVLTGLTEAMVDILATYVAKFHDVQTATLVMSFAAPRYVDDYRCTAWRNAYRAYLQRHKAFYQRTKFEVESTKRSKREHNGNGRPEIKPPSRQIALRCVYCDAETSLLRSSSSANISGVGGIPGPFGGGVGGRHHSSASITNATPVPPPLPPSSSSKNPGGGGGGAPNQPTAPSSSSAVTDKSSLNKNTNSSSSPASYNNPSSASSSSSSGIACPNCKRHLPRCVVCLEVVGLPRSSSGSSNNSLPSPPDFPESSALSFHHHTNNSTTATTTTTTASQLAAMRFPTFCLGCEHVLHLDHARQWFARHNECPVPECRCRCNFRANPELNYH